MKILEIRQKEMLEITPGAVKNVSHRLIDRMYQPWERIFDHGARSVETISKV